MRVGYEALNAMWRDEDGQPYRFFKAQMGTTWSENLAGRRINATWLTTRLLEAQLQAVAATLPEGESFTDMRWAFTYPASWGVRQVAAFNAAIQAAGISEYVTLSEPEAAALAGVYFARGEDGLDAGTGKILVLDVGAGTTDLAVVQSMPGKTVKLLGPVGGTSKLGMSNLDRYLALQAYDEAGLASSAEIEDVLRYTRITLEELKRAWDQAQVGSAASATSAVKERWLWQAEEFKITVCKIWGKGQDEFKFTLPNDLNVTIARTKIEAAFDAMRQGIRATVASYIASLQTEGVSPEHIEHLLICGGGSQLPGLEEAIRDLLPRATRLHLAENQLDKAERAYSLVQMGAALYAYDQRIDSRRFSTSYSVKAFHPKPPELPAEELEKVETLPVRGETMYAQPAFFIKRGDLLHEQRLKFAPVIDGQGSVRFRFYEGEHLTFYKAEYLSPDVNHPVAERTLDLPASADHNHEIELKVIPGKDGLLHVYACDPTTGAQTEELIIRWLPLEKSSTDIYLRS